MSERPRHSKRPSTARVFVVDRASRRLSAWNAAAIALHSFGVYVSARISNALRGDHRVRALFPSGTLNSKLLRPSPSLRIPFSPRLRLWQHEKAFVTYHALCSQSRLMRMLLELSNKRTRLLTELKVRILRCTPALMADTHNTIAFNKCACCILNSSFMRMRHSRCAFEWGIWNADSKSPGTLRT